MARYGGQFDPEIKRPGQFDAELNRGGQFDRDLIDTGTPDDSQDWFTLGTRSALTAALSLSLAASAICAGLQRQTDEIVSAGVTPVEEEYWRNPTPPIPASLIWPQQWTFDSQEPAGSLRGQPDEDFWVSGVAPVVASLSWPQQWTFDVQEPGGSLRGVPEEEAGPLRALPLAPFAAVVPFTATDDIVPQPGGTAPPDEDFWQSGVAPGISGLIWPQQWGFDAQEPAGSLRGVPEDDGAASLLPWAPPAFTVLFFGTSEDVVISLDVAPPDEDFWSSGVAPQPASLAWPQPWTFDQQEPAGSLRGVPEEDTWFPYRGSLLVPPPVIPRTDTDDVVQAQIPLPPDEDFWRSGVAPIAAALSWPQQWVFDSQDAVQPPLALAPDEDFWVSGVAPVAATLSWPRPWTFDVQEPGNLRGQPDEDFWRSGVAPVPASLTWPKPWSFEAPEALGTFPYGDVVNIHDVTAQGPAIWSLTADGPRIIDVASDGTRIDSVRAIQ